MPVRSPATTVCSGALKFAIQTSARCHRRVARARRRRTSGGAPMTATIVPGSASAAASIAAPRAATRRVAASRSRIPAAVERGVLAEAVAGGSRDAVCRARRVRRRTRGSPSRARTSRSARGRSAQRLVVGAQEQVRDVVTRDVGDRVHERPGVDCLPRFAHAGLLRALAREQQPDTVRRHAVMRRPACSACERVGFDVEAC